ncbi:MAG: sortase [Chloroflexi bacterium]|nr:MAG: sortase [Chloroflexota bacterium]
MYTRRRRISFVRLVIIGVVAGLGFIIFDALRNQAPSAEPSSPPTATAPVATVAPVDDITLPTATPAEAALDLSRPIPGQTTIFIPSLGIYQPVVETYLDGVSWDVSQLGNNVGHLEGTAWFNRPGNIALSGHVELADGRRGVFADLDNVKIGDIIELQQGDEVRRYAVAEVSTVSPDDLTPLYPSDIEMLTLITCGGYDFLSDSYQHRVVVVAIRVG